jgi:general secretion pathway protein C
MNPLIAKYINIALGAALIIVVAFFMRGLVVGKYTQLQLMEGRGAAEEPLRAGAGRGVGYQEGAGFAEYAPIVAGGLFAPAGELKFLGENEMAGKVVARQTGSLKSISLVGTVVGASGAKAYALFTDIKSNRQDIFKVGEEVFKAGRLTHVDKLTATILLSGNSYTLSMPKNSDMKALSSAANRGRRPAPPFGSTSGGRLPIAKAGDKTFARRVGERGWTVDRRALNELLSDTGSLLTQARILPYRVDGKTKGFRLTSIQRSGLFAIIGLRSGDILLKVNERAIDSPEKGIQLLSGLGGETNISLDILRGGKPAKLNYEIR